MARNRRPHRGPTRPNVLVEGDTGPRQPQHGAEPGATESGDLEAREFGVPQADIEGGVRHLVNPQTHPARPAIPPERPADYHKYHGVPSDTGQYVTPPTEADETDRPRPGPEMPEENAVPVYLTQGPGKTRRIRRLITEGPFAVPTATAPTDPLRIADRDPRRVKVWVCNEIAVLGTAAGTQGASTTTVGSVTSPAADATITSQALAAGVWTIGWTVQLSGTLGAIDANNFVMESNAVQVAQSLNSGAAGTYTQPPVTVVIPAGGATVEIEALALGTVNAVYQAQMTATPVPAAATPGGTTAGVRVGSLEDCALGRGLLLPAGSGPKDFNTQDALYVVNVSGVTVNISWGTETEVPAEGTGP